MSKGLYSVLLGDTTLAGMTAIPASVWANADVRLRVWFNDGTNGSQLLMPDQRLAPNGYLPTGAVSSTAIANGAVTTAHLADGSVTAAKLGVDVGGVSPGSWKTTGNAGANPLNGVFLGTTDLQSLEFRVNNQRGLRLEPTTTPDAVNGIGGSTRNVVGSGASGATIGGGGSGEFAGIFFNRVDADFGTVAGGGQNTIQTNSIGATIGGGTENTIESFGTYSVVDGGFQNMVLSYAFAATIGGGTQNTVEHSYGTVPGGRGNNATVDAFAAGRQAKANHEGAFVWADATGLDFASTADNQFLIRAAGHVGINKGNPATALDVNGTVTATGFSGNGGGLTSLNASHLTGSVPSVLLTSVPAANLTGAIPDSLLSSNQTFWRIDGNAGTTPGSAFVGTTDETALEFKVRGTRALRLEPTSDTITSGSVVNVIGGSPLNVVGSGVRGATIAGGGEMHVVTETPFNNRVTADFGTVSGGLGNTSGGRYATVGGGSTNLSNGHGSTVGGGRVNRSSGSAATVPGGYFNIAAGDWSFAAGSQARANHDGAFVWADATENEEFESTAANQFSIRATGGVRLSDSTPALSFGSRTRQMINLWDTEYGIGVQAGTLYFRCDTSPNENLAGFRWYKGGVHSDSLGAPGANGTEMMSLTELGLYVRGTFASISDRNAKENLTPVSARDVLEKVAAMPISRWNFKGDAATPHVGPMAQDFHAAFGLGTDDKHIATVDADGVALAAIQGLNQKLEEQLHEKDSRIAELERRIEKLEQLMIRENGRTR